jgi:CHAT domain-containing protein/predicted negative regulator of RcsB-dependent stress response
MARKWHLLFRRLQSILSKRYLIYGWGIVMLLFCVTIQPSLLTGERVNAASSLAVASDSADTLLEQSQQLYRSGSYDKAIEMLERAISIYRSRGDNLKQAMSLSNLALVHQALGQWAAANQAISDSLKLLQNKSNPGGYSILAQTLDIQGQLQLAQGQTEPALASWEQTEQLSAQMGDDGGVARSRINQCHALRVLGFYRRAQTILEDLQTTLASKPDSPIKVVLLRSLGIALEQSGDLDRAVAVLKQGLGTAEQLKLDREITATQLVLGNVLRTQEKLLIAERQGLNPTFLAADDYSKAIDLYLKAAASPANLVSIQARLNLLSLQIDNRKPNLAEQLITPIQQQLLTLPANRIKFNFQINFAESLAKLKHRETAARVLADVNQQSQKLTDRRIQSLSLGTLGELYKQQQQWQDAEAATNRALIAIANTNADDLVYRWYAQLGSILAQQGKDKQAIESYTVAIDTLKLLRKDLVNINRDVQFTFKESVEPTYRELVSLLLKPSNQTTEKNNLERSRNLIEALQVAELDNFFREACLNNENVIIDKLVSSLDNSQKSTAAIIYPIILENEMQVIVKIPARELQQHRVALNNQEVNIIIQNLRKNLLQTKVPDPVLKRKFQQESQKVYNWLIAPFESQFAGKVNTLVFVLDGELRNIPMSALYDGKQYLIEKYAVTTNLGLRLQSPQPISKSPLRILAAGLAKPSAKFASKFSVLEKVSSQLDAIRATGIAVTELKDEKFTIAAFGQEVKNAPYNVIHLATHGQFSSNINETFLLASDDKLNVVEFDRLLRDRAQIHRNPLELLVMSACQTAVGDNRATLGLAGVAVKAGAQSTLASLWKVTDDSTAVLMGEFYRELTTGEVSKAEALRRAQVKLLKESSNFSDPFYWAPFILVGNWL